jgi:hypothetical protein
MIKIKNSQLNNETISSLNYLMDMEINAKLAFKLMKIIKEISSLVEDKLKLEKRILEKNLERDDSGNPITALDDNGNVIQGGFKIKNSEDFNKEMGELMSLKIKLNLIKLDLMIWI